MYSHQRRRSNPSSGTIRFRITLAFCEIFYVKVKVAPLHVKQILRYSPGTALPTLSLGPNMGWEVNVTTQLFYFLQKTRCPFFLNRNVYKNDCLHRLDTLCFYCQEQCAVPLFRLYEMSCICLAL
jgi:hypothetical protein